MKAQSLRGRELAQLDGLGLDGEHSQIGRAADSDGNVVDHHRAKPDPCESHRVATRRQVEQLEDASRIALCRAGPLEGGSRDGDPDFSHGLRLGGDDPALNVAADRLCRQRPREETEDDEEDRAYKPCGGPPSPTS